MRDGFYYIDSCDFSGFRSSFSTGVSRLDAVLDGRGRTYLEASIDKFNNIAVSCISTDYLLTSKESPAVIRGKLKCLISIIHYIINYSKRNSSAVKSVVDLPEKYSVLSNLSSSSDDLGFPRFFSALVRSLPCKILCESDPVEVRSAVMRHLKKSNLCKSEQQVYEGEDLKVIQGDNEAAVYLLFLIFVLTKATELIDMLGRKRTFRPSPLTAQHIMFLAFCLDCPKIFRYACSIQDTFKTGDLCYDWDSCLFSLIRQRQQFPEYFMPLLSAKIQDKVTRFRDLLEANEAAAEVKKLRGIKAIENFSDDFVEECISVFGPSVKSILRTNHVSNHINVNKSLF